MQSEILDIKSFYTYSKAGTVIPEDQQVKYSLSHLLNRDPDFFNEMVFSSNQLSLSNNQIEENTKASYYCIKINRLELYGNHFRVINIQDQTVHIMFNISQGENRILQLVNACVSHEMRNPINAILSANLKLQESARGLNSLAREICQGDFFQITKY